jgi:uncharacterized membrane protein
MSTVQQSIEVDVPLHTAYNQWTQFEEFPRFMEGVTSVTQLDDTKLHWVVEFGGEREEWDAKITRQEPDRVIAWESTSGRRNAGTVTFEPLGSDRTRVNVEIEFEPEGIKESIGDAIGVVDRRVKGDLERFKEFIESRGAETGAWRGEVESGTPRR